MTYPNEQTRKIHQRFMRVITLCGSTKFKAEFDRVNEELTLDGHLVLSCGVWRHQGGQELTPEQCALLDMVHLEKIDRSEEIFVINVGGYIGDSTAREIAYATDKGKLITYLES